MTRDCDGSYFIFGCEISTCTLEMIKKAEDGLRAREFKLIDSMTEPDYARKHGFTVDERFNAQIKYAEIKKKRDWVQNFLGVVLKSKELKIEQLRQSQQGE